MSDIERITEEINKKIIENLKKEYSYFDVEKNKLYQDKFKIISSGDKTIPFEVYVKINHLINEDINRGFIKCKHKTKEGKYIYYDIIKLDKLHSISYIWDYLFPDKIIRTHQTEEEYEKTLKPMFLNYNLDLTDKTIVNKYYINVKK